MNISSADKLSTEQLLAFITQLLEGIRILENEITRLNKLNTKPDIKPNTKPSDNNNENNGNSQGDGDKPGGELSNLITKGHDSFHQEKDELLATGIRCSSHLQTDDAGSRHKGQNGYCTVITNEVFTWFGTTESKSRANFLTLLYQSNFLTTLLR